MTTRWFRHSMETWTNTSKSGRSLKKKSMLLFAWQRSTSLRSFSTLLGSSSRGILSSWQRSITTKARSRRRRVLARLLRRRNDLSPAERENSSKSFRLFMRLCPSLTGQDLTGALAELRSLMLHLSARQGACLPAVLIWSLLRAAA